MTEYSAYIRVFILTIKIQGTVISIKPQFQNLIIYFYILEKST